MFNVFAWKYEFTEIYSYVFICSKKNQNKEEFTQFYSFGYAGNNKYERRVTCIPLLPPCSHWQFAILMTHLKQSQPPWSCRSWISTILRETKGKVIWTPGVGRVHPDLPTLTPVPGAGLSTQLLTSLWQHNKLHPQACSRERGFSLWLQPLPPPMAYSSPLIPVNPIRVQSLSKCPNHVAAPTLVGIV